MSSLISAEEMTNLYLYGTSDVPSDFTSDQLLRPRVAIGKTSEDVNLYMDFGPGKYASPAAFSVIKEFMNPLGFPKEGLNK